jgi:hypothetical protein
MYHALQPTCIAYQDLTMYKMFIQYIYQYHHMLPICY